MILLLCYIVLYYNIDVIFKQIYLPYVITNNNYSVISNNEELYFLLTSTSYFMLLLYSYILTYKVIILNIYSIGIIFIYMKYIVDIIIHKNMLMIEYEISRGVMWAFTTPLMLKQYCKVNNITLQNINIHYHIICIVPHIFFIPFKNNSLYIISTIVFYIPEFFFLKTLYKYNQLPFTNLFILIWIIFMLINILEIIQLCNPIIIYAFYNIADTVCKFVCMAVISNYNEHEIIIRENMDLQSIFFVSHMIKSIKNFEMDNQNLTFFCKKLINYYRTKMENQIPLTNNKLKLELLKKILPFDLDRDYINVLDRNYIKHDVGVNKEFNFICILFMDIVNYTELATKYNGDIIFKLLNTIYNHFDTIIKKYKYLQKIETVGDAYMVVGDIFRNELNYKNVIKEIILLGLEFIKEIKQISTPDNIPLSIRIGINMGSVNIGILGNEIPRLCVVGNAVNVASRLQSTADIDTIQICSHIYEQIEYIDFEMNIEFTKKENVYLKNIGSVTTYNTK